MVQAISRDTKSSSESASPKAASYFVQFNPGDFVFKSGDTGEEMFIIEEGQVEIVAGTTVVTTLERGDFFGEMAILEDMPRSSSARAKAACKLLRIDRNLFDQMIRQNPEIAIRMLRSLSHRLRQASASAPVAHAAAPQGPAPGRIVTDAGASFDLSSTEATTVGRFDPSTGIRPVIDLGEADTDRSISRRHAKITRSDGKFLIVEEVGTSNGTFVNGTRLQPGVPVEIHNGDEVTFGRLKTKFQLA
ncbi:MAG: cyclic nucleotide-binding domain-containing protein [Thermoanaerobaculia bacterium]